MNNLLKASPALLIFLPFYFDLFDPLAGVYWPPDWISLVSSIRVPIPFSLLSFSYFLILDFSTSNTPFLLSKRQRFISLSCVVLFFLLGFFISQVSYVRLFQLSMPVVLFCLLKVPSLLVVRYRLRFALCGLLVFQIFHLLYLFLEYPNLFDLYFNINPKWWFVFFWDSLLYSGLVSFPAVILLSLCFIPLRQYCVNISKPSSGLLFPVFFVSLQLIYLLIASRKASIAILAVFICLYFAKNILPRLFLAFKVQRIFLLSILGGVFVSLTAFLVSAPIFTRLGAEASSADISSGRLDIYISFFKVFSSINPFGFFFGGSYGSLPPGFHNVFFDVFARVGLIGMFILFITLFAQFTFVLVPLLGSTIPDISISSLLLLSSLIVESLFNSQLTQPFYMVTVLFFLTMAASLSRCKILSSLSQPLLFAK